MIITNLIAGFGCAFPVVRFFKKVNSKPISTFRCFGIFIGIYFIEGIALGIGMGIPVFSVMLAFVWGVVFGLWFGSSMSVRNALKTALIMSLYSTLPMVSFIIIPIMGLIEGRGILSVEEGIRVGIPELPHMLSLFNTILGFYIALIFGALLFKTVITVGEVSLLIHLKKKPADKINDL